MVVKEEFAHTEALAEKFVDKVSEIKHLMQKGENDQCLNALSDMQDAMIVALAISESCCSDELH